MNLLYLFQTVLNEKYIQLEEETASYSCHLNGDVLYLFLSGATARPTGKTTWISPQSTTGKCPIAGTRTAAF